MNRLTKRFARPFCAPRTLQPRRRQLAIEGLEDRTVPYNYPVTDPGDTALGTGTLRDAIIAANSAGGVNTIDFEGTSFAGPQTILLESALPIITCDLTINGTGAANLTVRRDAAAPDFVIFAGSTGATNNLGFSGMTITGGSLGSGSGITGSRGDLTVTDCVLTNNNGGTGGGIYVPASQIGLTKVVDSTISGNTGSTGGIYFFSGGNLLVDRCTISGNTGTSTTSYHSGGIIFYGSIGSSGVTIQNSTITGNTAANSVGGAGINIQSATGTATIAYCTITNNTSTFATATGGGGVGITSGTVAVTITGSIIAGNSSPGGADVGISSGSTGDTVGGDNNLIGVDPGYFSGSNNQMGSAGAPLDPQLGPLQDNGGPTWTQLPNVGSPVLNTASATPMLAVDQRGFFRPSGSAADIGSAEVQVRAIPTITVDPTQNNPTNNASAVTFDVTFDQDVTGFDASQIDLSASTTAGTLMAFLTPVDGSHYMVSVTGMVGDGQVIAKVLAGTGSQGLNASGQNNVDSPGSATVTIDTRSPTVTVDKAPAQPDPTNASPVMFLVQFDEAVSGFDDTKVTLGGTLAPFASIQSVTGGPDVYLVAVAIAGSHTGTISASVAAGAVNDLAGNPTEASTGANTVGFDNERPTATVGLSAGQASTAGGSAVKFDVTFSEPVASFTTADLDLTGTNAPGATPTITGTGPDYTVTFTGMTGGGTISLAIDDGAVSDAAGNGTTAAGPITVTYIHSGSVHFAQPTYSIAEDGSPTLTVTVSRTDGSEGVLSVDYATADGTALAGTDYSGRTGTLTWGDGQFDDKTIDIPITDDGGFEADSTFAVNLSNATVSGAIGTPSSTAVTILETAGLSFSTTNFPTAEGDGTVTVTVQRLFDGTGPVTVNYAVSDGTANLGSDYGAPSGTGTLSWMDGDMTDKTFTIPITDDALSEGRETIRLALNTPTGFSELGPRPTAVVTIDHSDGTTITGSAKVTRSTFSEDGGAAGDLATITLGGKLGTLTYYRTNGSGAISEIDLAGTDPMKSTVSITVRKPRGGTGDGRLTVNEVDGSGLKAFTAKAVDLDGSGGLGFNLGGFLGSLTIGNIRGGAPLNLAGPAPTAKAATRITAGVIDDLTDITLTAPLGSLTAIAIGEGTITAPNVGSITIKGQKATKTLSAIPGNFESDLVVTGTGLTTPTTPALKSLKVAGAVILSKITVGSGPGTNGNVGSVSVGSFVDSELFAGYQGPTTGAGTFNTGTIGSFSVKGTTNAFAHSFVIAPTIKTVSLASLDSDNGTTKFGFLYHTLMRSLVLKGSTVKYSAAGPAEQDLVGDFYVKRV
jgi:hypothetical protein